MRARRLTQGSGRTLQGRRYARKVRQSNRRLHAGHFHAHGATGAQVFVPRHFACKCDGRMELEMTEQR